MAEWLHTAPCRVHATQVNFEEFFSLHHHRVAHDEHTSTEAMRLDSDSFFFLSVSIDPSSPSEPTTYAKSETKENETNFEIKKPNQSFKIVAVVERRSWSWLGFDSSHEDEIETTE